MPIQEVSLDGLKKLDMGKAAEAFQMHIRRAAMDCLDRPGEAKARKVLLQIDLVPVLEDDGDCTEVHGQIQVTSKFPNHRTKVYSFGLRKNGQLVFSEDSPEDFGSPTLFEEQE